MTTRTITLTITLALLALTSRARADDISPGRAFTLRIGGGGDVLAGPDRVAPVVLLAGLLPLGEWAGIELEARVGLDPEVGVGRGWVTLGAGFRAEIPLDAWRPYASLRIAHTHDAPIAAWGDQFGATLAGDPSHGLLHLTALGGAIGLAWFVPGTGRRFVVGAEASVLGRIHGHDHEGAQHRAPDAWIGGSVQLGWQFL